MTTYNQYYLEGIREGRAFLKCWPDSDPQTELNACQRTIKSGFGAQNPVGQTLRGERDFWKNQIRKGAT